MVDKSTNRQIVCFPDIRLMNFPAASRGVSVKDNFNPNAASCGELNPADFAISTSLLF